MDNFMDKLAKRFNAGEIIKANAQAEARDMKRMQERTAEYERMMQEMRRLNLKNVEVTEQVQQLIQCGIEQFEGYGSGEELLGNKIDGTADTVKETAESIREEMLSVKREISDAAVKTDDGFYQMGGRLDEIERSVNDGLRQNQQSLYDALRTLEEKIGTDSSMEEALAKIETAVSSGRYATEENLREMSELVCRMEESLQSMREILVATRISVEEGQKRLEEHVHKENVRVYRNVQAVITDEATKKARDIGMRLDQLETGAKKSSGVKPLLVLTLLLALASVGIQVAQMLQLL